MIKFTKTPTENQSSFTSHTDTLKVSVEFDEGDWQEALEYFYSFMLGSGYSIDREDVFVEDAFEAARRDRQEEERAEKTRLEGVALDFFLRVDACKSIKQVRALINPVRIAFEEAEIYVTRKN